MTFPPNPSATARSAAASVQRDVIRSYTLALLLIACAVTGTFLTMRAMISHHSESAWLINESGRQRMLSQRISLELTQLAIADASPDVSALRESVSGDLDTFLASHYALIEAAGGAERMSDALRALYFDAEAGADRAVQDFVAGVRGLLSQPDALTPASAGALAEQAKTSLLDALNAVVLQHQLQTEGRVHFLDRVELTIYLLTLVVLALEVLFIFRPLVQEIGRRTRALAEMTYRASHDDLTGLPNRRFFSDHIANALRAGVRNSRQTGILHIDLDGFKEVNDRLGHAAGDEVLCRVAAVLRQEARAADFVARLGGDEFVVLLADAKSREDVEALASRLIRALQAPLPAAGAHVHIGASIGLALQPYSDQPTSESLLLESDRALYQAKLRGKAGWSWLTSPAS